MRALGGNHEAYDRAKALYAEGLSATEIAAKISSGFGIIVSRNVIIGLAHRYGWIRGKASSPEERAAREEQARQRAEALPAPAQAKAEAARRPCEDSRARLPGDLALPALSSLSSSAIESYFRDEGCQWPTGTAPDGSLLKCGAPLGRKSYCAHHAAASVERPAQKRARQGWSDERRKGQRLKAIRLASARSEARS